MCQTFGVRCSIAQPKPFREASHFILVSKSGIKCLFSVVSAIFSFINLNCFSCSSGRINFVFFLSRGLSGKHNCDNFGINLPRWWTDPITDLSFLRFEGEDSFSIASILCDNGFKPVWVMLCPSHSILSFAKWHFARFIRRFSWSSFTKHFRTRSRCCSIPPLLAISILSKKQNVLFKPARVQSIAFWIRFGWHICRTINSRFKTICSGLIAAYKSEVTMVGRITM